MKCFELRMLYSSCTLWSAVLPQPSRAVVPERTCTPGYRKRTTYLTCRIDDLGGIFLILVSNDLAERVFDGGIVALHKVTVDELYRQARFACAVSLCKTWWGSGGVAEGGADQLLYCRQWQSCAAWDRPCWMLAAACEEEDFEVCWARPRRGGADVALSWTLALPQLASRGSERAPASCRSYWKQTNPIRYGSWIHRV